MCKNKLFSFQKKALLKTKSPLSDMVDTHIKKMFIKVTSRIFIYVTVKNEYQTPIQEVISFAILQTYKVFKTHGAIDQQVEYKQKISQKLLLQKY